MTEPAEGVASMEDLASGVVSEEKFRNWLEAGSTEIQYCQGLGGSDKGQGSSG